MYTLAQPPQAVELALQSIAIESNVLSNMARSFLTRFMPLKDFLSKSFSFTGEVPKEDLELTRVESKLCQRVNGSNFVAVSKRQVNTAPGWNVQLLAVQPTIADMLEECKTFEADILRPHYIFLSSYLSNKEAKVKGTDRTFTYKKLEQQRVASLAHRSKYFGDATNKGSLPMHRLVGRAFELAHIFDNIGRTRKQFELVDFKAVRESIASTTVLLDEIITQLQDGAIEGMPPETAQTIAAGTYEIAQQAEFISLNATVIMNYLAFGPQLVATLQAAEKEGII